MGMDLQVTSDIIATLLAEAARTAPEECCGLLLGRGERIARITPAANVADDRRSRFEIDPAALVAAHRAARTGGPDLVGYYHSHPAGHARPSAVDCAHASGDRRVWAIVARGEVTFWRDGEAGFEPLSYGVVPG
jgi:proteasome lid subunit RPN8/RPN11